MTRFLVCLTSALLNSGCYFTYILESGYNQAKILTHAQPLEEIYTDPDSPEETKRKLKLVEATKTFAEENLGLKKDRNYTQFVKLDRPYVSYVVSAAPRHELKAYTWSFPIVGEVPYKGFFDQEKANRQASELAKEGLDVSVRGVSAYSTLGYFRDPILSSMLNDSDHELVSLIIHETVHTNLWIKNNAKFNERLAVFLGTKGAIEFYRFREGPNSETVGLILAEAHDEKIFSAFITKEIQDLKSWYSENSTPPENSRQERLNSIRERFRKSVLPQLKSEAYSRFAERPLNNAHLVMYDVYFSDLQDFERLWEKEGRDFKRALNRFKELEKAEDPEESLRSL